MTSLPHRLDVLREAGCDVRVLPAIPGEQAEIRVSRGGFVVIARAATDGLALGFLEAVARELMSEESQS